MKAQQLGNPLGAHLTVVASLSSSLPSHPHPSSPSPSCNAHFHFDPNLLFTLRVSAAMVQLTCIKYDVANPLRPSDGSENIDKTGFTALAFPSIASCTLLCGTNGGLPLWGSNSFSHQRVLVVGAFLSHEEPLASFSNFLSDRNNCKKNKQKILHNFVS